MDKEKMLQSYLYTALWSTADTDDAALNENYSVDDIAKETINTARSNINLFIIKAKGLLDDLDEAQIGHDFWLTRHHHGSGFWDGDYDKEVGDKLTKISDTFRELTPLVGDDGDIHFE